MYYIFLLDVPGALSLIFWQLISSQTDLEIVLNAQLNMNYYPLGVGYKYVDGHSETHALPTV